jgi:plasmid stability protein
VFGEPDVKNITISMDEELARRIRIAAATAGKSMSSYLAEAGREKLERQSENSTRNLQLEAIERFLAGPQLHLSEEGRMPNAEERNERRWQRDLR